MKRLNISMLLFFIPFLNIHAQSGKQKFDSLTQEAWRAVAQEDIHRIEFYINALKPFTDKSTIETIDLLTAEKLILQADYQQGLGYIAKLKQSHSPTVVIHSLVLEGKVLALQNQFNASISTLQSVLGNKRVDQEGECLRWLGTSLMQSGRSKEAHETLQHAIKCFQSDSAKFYVKIALVRIMGGINFKRTGDYTSAEREYRLAINILENTPIPKYRDLSRAYINLANAYNDQWNYVQAKSYYLKGLTLNQTQLRDSSQLTILYNNMGQFYQKYGNLLASKKYYDEWYALFSIVKQKFYGTGMVMLINYGAFLGEIFEYEQARKILSEAESYLNENSRLEDQVLLLLAKAENFEHLNMPDSIESQLQKARDVLLKLPEQHKFWFSFYRQESLQAIERKNFVSADSLIDLAIRAARKLNEDSTNSLSGAYWNRALNYERQDKNHEAAIYYKYSIQLSRRILPPFHPRIIMLLNNTGIAYFKNSEFDSAIRFFMEALQSNHLPGKDVDQFSDPFEVLVSNYHILRILMKKNPNELKDGEIYIVTAMSLIEDKRQSFKSFEDQLSYNRVVRDFFDIAIKYYHSLFIKTGDDQYFKKAFEMAEKARYQVLQHSLHKVRIGEFAGVTQKISDEEQILQKELGLLTKQIIEETCLGSDANPDILREYNTRLGGLQMRHEKIIDSIRNNLPGLYNLKFSTTTATPNDIRGSLLNADMALVQYHVGFEQVHLLVISKEKNYSLVLSEKTNVVRSIRKLSNVNRLRMHDEFVEAASELYKLLVYPVDSIHRASNYKVRQYLIVPDGEINYVPFDVLVTKPADELSKCKFLLHDKILSYGYSSTLLWQEFSDYSQPLQNIKVLSYAPTFNQESQDMSSDQGLRNVVAKSSYANYAFRPLQNNAVEVNSISKIVRQKGYQDETVFGEQADEASFKGKSLNDYQIIHLATHGFVDYPTNQSSGIAFTFKETSGEDGILFMDEIFSLRSKAHLLCLSACQTGFGRVDVGEGMMSMTRAFLYSGVKNLVVSLWSVQDNSTAILMENFYKQFVKSKSISLSLRSAKLQMLKEKEFSHPYNWAGFIHVGLN